MVVNACLELRSKDSSSSPYLFLNENSEDGKMHLRVLDDYLREVIHYKVLGLGNDKVHMIVDASRRRNSGIDKVQ